jgi:hypothetical protein
MRNMRHADIAVVGTAVALAAGLLVGTQAAAHCDTLGGPVVATARVALESDDVTPVLKWVRPEHEQEIRTAFAEALAVRELGPEAREMADRYFFETLVRIHREGEGAPYTGLKPAGDVDPAVAMADQALDSGSAERLAGAVSGHVVDGIRQRFARAVEAKKHAEESVEAGREFVEAYVEFTHYVEGIHQLATARAAHHGDAANESVESHKH